MEQQFDFDDLAQIELAAQDASAALLRFLIQQVDRKMAREPEACGEHGQILLLKLHHLLTQHQVHAAAAAVDTVYLAPELVIDGVARGRKPARPRRARGASPSAAR